MGEPRRDIDEYRATFGNGFDPRRLWRDRRAILAEPRICTEPSPPLSFPPLRFALTLVIVPMLACAWLASQLAGVLYPDGPPPGAMAAAAQAIEAPLDAFLGRPDDATLRALAAPKLDALGTEGKAMVESARDRLVLVPQSQPDAGPLATAAEAFVAQVRAAPLSPAQQRQAVAEILKAVRARRRIDGVVSGLLRNFMEGGAGMQVLSAIALVVTARLFRASVRRDPRFPRGERGAELFLYYGTARLFWLSVASIVAYTLLAFASASGNLALLAQAQAANQALALVSLAWLLFFTRDFVRALREDDALPAGARAAVGWKLLWTQVVANLLLIAAATVFGIVLGVAAAFWFMRA